MISSTRLRSTTTSETTSTTRSSNSSRGSTPTSDRSKPRAASTSASIRPSSPHLRRRPRNPPRRHNPHRHRPTHRLQTAPRPLPTVCLPRLTAPHQEPRRQTELLRPLHLLKEELLLLSHRLKVLHQQKEHLQRYHLQMAHRPQCLQPKEHQRLRLVKVLRLRLRLLKGHRLQLPIVR